MCMDREVRKKGVNYELIYLSLSRIHYVISIFMLWNTGEPLVRILGVDADSRHASATR